MGTNSEYEQESEYELQRHTPTRYSGRKQIVQKSVTPLYGYGDDLFENFNIEWIMEEFVPAAKRARSAGAEGMDRKLCRGRLGLQILRPHDERKWQYGGPWEICGRREGFPVGFWTGDSSDGLELLNV